ncbi:hypothetical protein MPLB_1380007 [Mesorhizobium sp. ORS 3324]|nr:hypothetical protein MPLB_1380007 [Mesorhizobium sp. ORS 3324]
MHLEEEAAEAAFDAQRVATQIVVQIGTSKGQERKSKQWLGWEGSPTDGTTILDDLNVPSQPFQSFGSVDHEQECLAGRGRLGLEWGYASFGGCGRSWLPTGIAAREEAV